jgi:pimeloyl-ACP methyl ester carboxylesterase
MKQKLLLLHGALGCGDQFYYLRDLLEPHFDVMVYTFSNHGKKALHQHPFTIESLAHELSGFLREQITEPIPVFGYSMGGYIALWLAKNEPELFSKVITLGTKFNWNEATAKHETQFLHPQKIEEKVPAFAKHLQQLHGSNWKKLVENTADMMRHLANNHLSHSDLKNIEQPVWVCLGDSDNMVTKEESKSAALAIPNGKFQVLENTLHPIEKINQHTIYELICNYLN